MTEGKLQNANVEGQDSQRNSRTRRLRVLRTTMNAKGLDTLLVSQPENRRYLSGFVGSAGWLLVSEKSAILATDFRYVEQARHQSPDFEIVRTKRELREWFPDLISSLGCRRLGFEADFVSYEGYQKLGEAIGSQEIGVELVPSTGIVEQLRSIKEPEELALITKAAELVDTAFEQVTQVGRPGMTEKALAWELEKSLRQQGSEEMPFEIIVASGPNSALPHARPTDKRVSSGEPVLIDMGAKINGYCSDFTRTFFLGKADKTLKHIYDIVLKAQVAAIEGIQSGMDGPQADRFARSVIEQTGYGDVFGHGLGHGVGLAVHELPTVGPSSSDALVDGMVFTVEPGIYLVGQGGVRIEDTVVLEDGKVRALTKASKDILEQSVLGGQ
jgi:Xaa-Pro aminopeptidase